MVKSVITVATAFLLLSCDETARESTENRHKAENQPHTETSAHEKKAITIPETRTEHASAITELRMHRRADSRYVEEVKLLAEHYLSRYPEDTAGSTSATLCYIETLMSQPERFAGSDFDRALHYCTILEEMGHTSPAPSVLRNCIAVADYRKSDEAKANALQELAAQADHALKQQDYPSAAYALRTLTQHCPENEQPHHAERYWQQADYAGAPFRAEMLLAGGLNEVAILPLLEQEAQYTLQHPEARYRLRAFFRNILQINSADTLLQNISEGKARPLLLCELLRHTLNDSNSHPSVAHSIMHELQQIPPADLPQDTALLSAIYNAKYATEATIREQALNTCLNFTAETNEDRFLLAGALKQAGATTAHREAAKKLYRHIAAESSPQETRLAMQALVLIMVDEQNYREADSILRELQNNTREAEEWARLQQQRAEYAVVTGNLNAAIDLYSQLQLQYLGTLHISVPACMHMLNLLQERNFPRKVDKKTHTITPSDKWYAWTRGRDFLKSLDRNPELIATADKATQQTLEQLRHCVNTLSIDYNVQTEERDRAEQNN
ncbi:MAG: hypothetical protein Q4A24_06255 [Akkermansia sp.]|nr:hypothetical protein [Akkermansia sp.]